MPTISEIRRRCEQVIEATQLCRPNESEDFFRFAGAVLGRKFSSWEKQITRRMLDRRGAQGPKEVVELLERIKRLPARGINRTHRKARDRLRRKILAKAKELGII